jgi:hypothetical protein
VQEKRARSWRRRRTDVDALILLSEVLNFDFARKPIEVYEVEVRCKQ